MSKTRDKKPIKSKNEKLENELKPNSISSSLLIQDGRWKKIVGLAFILLGIFFSLSLITYFYTWKHDQSSVVSANSTFDFLFKEDSSIANGAGRMGAWFSHSIIYNGIGILALLLIPITFGIGYNLFPDVRKLKLKKILFYTSVFALVLSPILSFLFSPKEIYGGAYGTAVNNLFDGFAGHIGTGFILFGALLALIIGLFNPKFEFLNSLLNKSKEKLQQSKENIETKLNESALNESLDIKSIKIHSDFEEKIKEGNQLVQNEKENEKENEDESEEVKLNEDDFTIENKEVINKENILEQELVIESFSPVLDKKPIENAEDYQLEVTQKEEATIDIENAHISIENAEPYDPSLELRNYKFPTLDLLEDRGTTNTTSIDKEELERNKVQIIQTLKNFGISIAKISATVGPTVTLYEIVPAEGVRISKIRNLEDDIALSLAALGIRIIAPIPGKGTIGIEVPNLKKQIVNMRTLVASEKFANNNFNLPIALGKKIDNENYIVDLATMPHLLMAGATGQGKSVGLNAILVSLLYKKHPSQLKFVLVDPKKVELSVYSLIEKHFLAKLPNEEEAIITDTKKVINTLNALCIEMDTRYDLLKKAGVRNIKEYNDKFIKRKLNPNNGHTYLPYIVLVVDEFADLIMTAGKEVEMPIARLAQLARAIGIHLIIATQRPSVNVITGTIKANFPARIAFRVSAKVDSRTILDAGGAEQLIGKGDMLISNGSELVRLQCAFVDTPEVEKIVDFIGEQQGYPTAFELPEYVGADEEGNGSGKTLTEVDNMFEQAARLVVSSQSGSTSMLQRRFNLGYNRAGRIMDQLEAAGVVGPSVGGKPRDVICKTEMELQEILLRILP